MSDLEAIGHTVILPNGIRGTIKAVAQSGNYWVKVGKRYLLANPEKCQLKGRHTLPKGKMVWETQAEAR